MASSAADHRLQTIIKFCDSLARGIDNALARNRVPTTASRIPLLVKQVYCQTKDTSLQSTFALLMISVKNACRNGWFHGAEADELLQLANEVLRSLCMNMSNTTEASNALATISMVIPRYLPQLKLDRLISYFEAKPGYDVLMADFHVQKSLAPDEKMWLFVVRNDDMRTSSCLISPPQVSFLVNGKGIAGRTNVNLDTGPQFPTDITGIIKCGTNIIQAVGLFNGNYVIAVASMSKVPSIVPNLKVYIRPVATEPVPDSDILEGPSRLSLICPISLTRIKTPVKGHLCKHHQCFDYNNFMEINSRKPWWHCPCCNQTTSFIDLCIDQNMVKILHDVTPDIPDVFINLDGSWRVALYNGSTNQLHNGALAKPYDNEIIGDAIKISNAASNILDLTLNEDDSAENMTLETEDRKPFQKFQGVPLSSPEQPLTHVQTSVPQGLTDAPRVEGFSSHNPSIVMNSIVTDAAPALGRDTANVSPSVSYRPVASATAFRDELNSGDMEMQLATSASDFVSPNIPSLPQNLDPSRTLNSAFQQSSRSNHQIPHQQLLLNPRGHQAMTQCVNAPHSSAVQNSSQNAQNVFAGSLNHHQLLAQRIARLNRAQPAQPIEPGAGSSLQTAAETSRAEGDWRPAGKMRGSLTGSAYKDALNRFLAKKPSQ